MGAASEIPQVNSAASRPHCMHIKRLRFPFAFLFHLFIHSPRYIVVPPSHHITNSESYGNNTKSVATVYIGPFYPMFYAISRNSQTIWRREEEKSRENNPSQAFTYCVRFFWIFSIITRLATYCRQCYRHVTSFTTYHNRKTVLTIRMVRRCFEMTHSNLTGRICEYSTQINPNGCTCGPGQVMKNNNIMDIYRIYSRSLCIDGETFNDQPIITC